MASECINVLKLGALPAAPEIALGLKGFMSEDLGGEEPKSG